MVGGVEVQLTVVVGVDNAHVVDLDDVDGQWIGLEQAPFRGV